MSDPSLHLGDPHNFGRRVTLRGDRIVKPRTLLWEWLVLTKASPLRQLLEPIEHEGEQAFDFLPDLAIPSPGDVGGGEVERMTLDALPLLSDGGKRQLAGVVGRAIALYGWLGIADLHWENLVLGGGPGGQMVFAPLDVEMILGDLSSPTETKLLPDADPEVAVICQHAAGVRRALAYLGKPLDGDCLVAMAAAYHRALVSLDRHAEAIASVFASLPSLREAPIRVLLRGTDEYVRARSEPVWPPLLDAEAAQLARGDIPYFFRHYGETGIHYYADQSLATRGRLPLRGDVPQLGPILSLARGLTSPSRKKLREEGLFALLGAFDHPSIKGRHEHAGFVVTFQRRTLTVERPKGATLETGRDLRAFVGSVYLPCQCGEVCAPFVPAVTVCAAQ